MNAITIKNGVTRPRWYKKGKSEGANLAHQSSDDSEDVMVMNAVADEHVGTKIWFLDTGCSNHMTG